MGNRTGDLLNVTQRNSSLPAVASGANTPSWADNAFLEPVLDDGRRSITNAAPPTSPTTGDRYIVGVNVTGAWNGKIGALVEWNGASWDELTEYVGAQVYSDKRLENLTLVSTQNKNIAPTLTPEYLEAPHVAVMNFWMPNSLIDTLYMREKGTIKSATTDSSSWGDDLYSRYIVGDSDSNYSAYENYIATLIADNVSHQAEWVFQPAREGDWVYAEDDNSVYIFNGTDWVVFQGGVTGSNALLAAEGRVSSDPTTETITFVADADNVWEKIPFAYSAVTDTAICPLIMFDDGDDRVTIQRTGWYEVYYSAFGFRPAILGTFPENLYLSVQLNDAVIHQFKVPDIDDFEGKAWLGLFHFEVGDEVSFNIKTHGTDWDAEFDILSGPNFIVKSADIFGSGSEVPVHGLNDHSDTNLGDAGSRTNNYYIKWDSGTGKFVLAAVSATADPHNIISSSHGDTVLTGSLTSGHVLIRNGLSQWTNRFLVLNDIANVTVTSPADQDVLVYSSGSSKFINIPFSSLSAGHPLENHTNVQVSGKLNKDVLAWDTGTSKWINIRFTLANLTDVPTPTTPGTSLTYNGSSFVWTSPSATVSFAGGTYENIGGSNWTVYGGVQVNCSTSAWTFIAGVNGYWKAEVTVAPLVPGGSPDSSGTFQWYVNGTAVGASFGTGSAGNVALQTFSAIFGLGAGSAMALGIDPTKMKYVKATFEKVGN